MKQDNTDGWEKTPHRKLKKGCKKPFVVLYRTRKHNSTPSAWRVYRRYKTEKAAINAVKSCPRTWNNIFPWGEPRTKYEFKLKE